ncbi:MAG: Gfo/Idh/MocA family oxidoreductase [Candidatus Omnitrophica bacterium]|nr:Gfo/Idh/MocA family oxidoreductase [Candidatus Omnitrophota bacterium]
MEILKFAIVGCGRIAPRHADSIASLKNAKLWAVCDIKKERADLFGKKYRAKIYYSLNKLLKDKEIDIVDICTPSYLHAEMGIQAANKGKHIIVEKPMALNLKDANNLISASKENKVKLSVVLQNRFNPAMKDLKKLVESKKLGKIYLASVCVRWFRPQSYYEDEWHGKKGTGDGVVINQTSHHLDALVWLLGMPKSVFAYTGTLAHKTEVEDVATAVFKYKNGALAVLETSTFTYPQNLEGSIALFGKNGSVKVGGTALNRKIFWKIKGELDKEEEILEKEKGEPPSVYGFSHKEVIKDMIKAVLNSREPKTNGYEGKKSLELILAIYKSAKEKKEVKING